MSKNVILIAGVVLAVGTVAAISAPLFRAGGHMRHGSMFGERGGGPFGASPVRFGERLKELDSNKDGVVTLDEFLARRNPTFARIDKNNDGVIDRAEFEAAAKETANYWVKRFIKRFDADRDGRIGKDEFAKARRERFAMRDRDGDFGMGVEDRPRGMRERFDRWRGERDKAGKEEAGKDGKEADKDAKERGPSTLQRLLGRLDRQFDRLDKNGDGFIDAKDLEPLAAERV